MRGLRRKSRMIKQEEVREALNNICYDVGTYKKAELYVGDFFSTPKDFQMIDDYIAEQQKKDELLELYREHKKLVPFTPGLGEQSKRVLDISIEIKALEEELK